MVSACTAMALDSIGNRFGCVFDGGAAAQAVCTAGQFLVGNSAEVMPMSPRNAPKVCCSTVGWLAFQPKRPRALCWSVKSQTWLGWPPLAAAKPRIVDSLTASSRPRPTWTGATRGETKRSGGIGPKLSEAIE